jgi:hypothetical protein
VFALAVLAVAASVAAAGPERRALLYTRSFALPAEAIWIADVDGRSRRRLVAGWGGRLSPDGRWVAFQRCRRPRWNCGATLPELWLAPVAGGPPRLLSRWTSVVDWSPDSRRIIATRGRSLVSIERSTGDMTVLDRGQFHGFSFSPDGRSLAYSRGPGSGICDLTADLHVVRLAGGGRRRLTNDGRSAFPVWGAPGIAFARDRGCLQFGVWRMRHDGSRVERLVARTPRRYERLGTYGLRPYEWFPGGRRLLIGIRTEWGDLAAVLDVRTRSIRRLGPHVDALSRDGRFLLGTRAGAELPNTIEIVRVADGRRGLVARGRVCCAHWNR